MKDFESDHSYEEEPKKKKKFRLFDSQREGKGVSKEDAVITPDIKGFFKSFARNFNKLLSVNIFMILGNFPFIFAVLALSGIFKKLYMAPASSMFSTVHSLMLLDGNSAANMALFGIEGIQIENSALTSASYVLWGLSALMIFTFGLVNVGTTYLIRNLIKGDPVFLWSDFWYAIKRNTKQGLLFGILDAVLLFLIPFNIIFLLSSAMTLFQTIIFWLNVVFGVLYLFMRFYAYLQMITFDLSIYKILKNSFIFAMIGWKRNFLALFWIGALVALNFTLIFGLGGILLPLGIAMPFIILFAAGTHASTFAAYFKIKEIMIDPYTEESAPYPQETPLDA